MVARHYRVVRVCCRVAIIAQPERAETPQLPWSGPIDVENMVGSLAYFTKQLNSDAAVMYVR